MTTTDVTVDLTTPMLPLDRVRQHPKNARRSAVADDEMVDSIRSIGIAQAVTVAPAYDWDGYYALGGNRRVDGAGKAGLHEIPVMLREDLVTEAQQLEFMLVENLHRSDLSPAEEAAAYEQLTLFGHDVDAIAAATGRAKSTIKARLKLTTLPAGAFELIHDGQLTLGDADAMLEFADDPAALEQLEHAAGTPNFRTAVYAVRDRRERVARHREALDEFEAAGAAEWTPLDGETLSWSRTTVCPLTWFHGDEREPHGHTTGDGGCLGYYYAGSDSYANPALICTDAARHAEPVDTDAETRRAQQQSQWEKDQAEREARAARRTAAADARLDWLREHFTAMFTPRTHATLAKAAAAALPLLITAPRAEDAIDSRTLLAALGVSHEDRTHAGEERGRRIAAATVSGAKATHALATFAAWAAASVASALDAVDELSDDLIEVQYALSVWDWMKAAGYDLSDVDKEIRTELEVRHTELVTENAEAS